MSCGGHPPSHVRPPPPRLPLARCLAAGLAFWAVARHPYDFYVLTRWVVCMTCLWGLVLCRRRPWPSPAPAYALVAIVFNPLLPFHFARAT